MYEFLSKTIISVQVKVCASGTCHDEKLIEQCNPSSQGSLRVSHHFLWACVVFWKTHEVPLCLSPRIKLDTVISRRLHRSCPKSEPDTGRPILLRCQTLREGECWGINLQPVCRRGFNLRRRSFPSAIIVLFSKTRINNCSGSVII